MVKNPHATQETRVHSLDWEDPLQKEMATHSSILDWEFPWIEEPGGLQSMASQESDTTYRLNHQYLFTYLPTYLSIYLITASITKTKYGQSRKRKLTHAPPH